MLFVPQKKSHVGKENEKMSVKAKKKREERKNECKNKERPGTSLGDFALDAVGLDQAVLARVAAVALTATPAPVVVLARSCALAVAAVVAAAFVLAHVC